MTKGIRIMAYATANDAIVGCLRNIVDIARLSQQLMVLNEERERIENRYQDINRDIAATARVLEQERKHLQGLPSGQYAELCSCLGSKSHILGSKSHILG